MMRPHERPVHENLEGAHRHFVCGAYEWWVENPLGAEVHWRTAVGCLEAIRLGRSLQRHRERLVREGFQ